MVDIHCVTKWTKLDTTWTGCLVDTLLEAVEPPEAEHVIAFCDGGYTTNLPLEDLTGRQGLGGATATTASRCAPEHGGPARLLVPHLYFWKSAKWVRGLRLIDARRARLLGVARLPQPTATRGRSSATGATEPAAARTVAWRQATVRETVDGDAARPDARARRARLAGPPRRPARRRAPDRRGRLPGPAQLLDRLGARGSRLELTVERIDDGEVSPYLPDELRAGDQLELRGPIGGYFVWEPRQGGPLLLVAGGSGVVPLMAMLRHRAARGSEVAGAPAVLLAHRSRT